MAELPIPVTRYVEEDRRKAFMYRHQSRGEATWQTDMRVWRRFSAFLGSKDPWTACPEDIAAYCAFRADNGTSPHTIESELSSLNFVYEKLGKGHFIGRTGQATVVPSPSRNPIVRGTIKGIWKLCRPPQIPRKPILLDLLEALIDVQKDNLFGIRNRAFLALTWAGARRIREVSSLDLQPRAGGGGHIEFRSDGFVIYLNHSKSKKPGGEPEFYGIPKRISAPRYCPYYLVQSWIEAAGVSEGALFPAVRNNNVRWRDRTSQHTYAAVLRSSLLALDLNPEEYGLRSLRAGCIAWLLSEGVHPDRIVEHTGQKRLSTMIRYVRNSNSIATSPLADTRWVR